MTSQKKQCKQPVTPECFRENCTAPIVHWHSTNGYIYACMDALNGRECRHDNDSMLRCYAPRTVPTEPSGVERVCRILSFAHGVTVTREQLAATLDELGLTLSARAALDEEG